MRINRNGQGDNPMALPPEIDRTHHVDGVLARYEPAKPDLILPLILDSPHSGHAYPPDFRHVPPRSLLRRAEDAFVDDLFETAPLHGAVFLKALFPRSYIDPNRHEDEIDLTIMEEAWPNPVIASEKAEMGLGLIRRLIKGNVEIYDRPLSVAEVKGRIDRFHRPYLTELAQLADRAQAEFGGVWHLNCHSMRSHGRRRGEKIPRADFVLGDRDGTSCMPAWAMTWLFLPATSWPLNMILPERGVTTPIRLFSVVLLPAPLRPSSATTSLRVTFSDTSNRMCESP